MRQALQQVRTFANWERKQEAAENIVTFRKKYIWTLALVHWVKVVYEKELLKNKEKIRGSLNLINSQGNFTRSHIKSILSQSIQSSEVYPFDSCNVISSIDKSNFKR